MHPQPRILVIIGAMAAFTVAIGGALADSTAAAEPTIVVEAGDTLSQIALEHGLTVEGLTALNRLGDPNRIYAGQELMLEAPTPAAPTPAAPRPAAPRPAVPRPAAAAQPPAAQVAARIHLIQAGECLIAIADRYGTTVAAIAQANHLSNPSFIRAGDRLRIPRPVATPPGRPAAAAATPTTAITLHMVQAGENLTSVAAHYGTTIAAIAQANAITNPSFIRAGDQLRIPGARPARAAAAKSHSMPGLSAAQRQVRAVIVEEAHLFAVPPALALAVAWQESGWRQGALSEAGAVGVMQLLPATGVWVAQGILHEPVDIGELRSNVRAGVCLLAHYLDRYGGDRDRTLAAYYQGQRAVDTLGIYAMSRPYIASILALEVRFTGS
ncbi:MAG: LysM peptidoglycan-binding domain-containing protein [Chloroflexota bacterium]|nr:LysM peptidoglycan-binding domain-containing protein [Chloroflexota bacterium]